MKPYTGPERRRFPRTAAEPAMPDHCRRLRDCFRPNWWAVMTVLAVLMWATFFAYAAGLYYGIITP